MCSLPVRNDGNFIIAITVAFTVVAVIAVFFRVSGRLMHRERKLMLDDYAIIITTVRSRHRRWMSLPC